MRKITFFFLLLIVSFGLLVILLGVNLYLSALNSSTYPSWMEQMWQQMGGMMGGTQPMQTTPTAVPSFLWVIPVALVGLALVGVAGVVYFVAFPEIKTTQLAPRRTPNTELNQGASPSSPLESVLKTSTHEERRVLEVLASHDGRYLQKYIRKEAGLSRLKTHRILARLSERGIVTLTQSGNTNEVVLADWLKKT